MTSEGVAGDVYPSAIDWELWWCDNLRVAVYNEIMSQVEQRKRI